MITVLLADDSAITRQGLRAVLECDPDLHIVAEAWDGTSAIEAARRHQPDVALVDIHMPSMDGISATRHLRALPRPCHVLVLTMLGDDQYVKDTIHAGACGYLLKDTPPEQLLAHIHSVAAGHHVLDPAVTKAVLDCVKETQTPAHDEAPTNLTDHEVELLRLVSQGLSNADIAGALDASETATKSKVSRLMAKLGATNRVQLARIGFRAGLDRV